MSVNKDQSMSEFDRRHAGAYFTKLEWAREAHNLLEAHLGADWRDKYIVWDCAAGTGNLTREYDFDDLLLSTLDQEEVDIIVNEGLNGGACVFQYDFLSCAALPVDAQSRLDAAVKAGKSLLFLINPPYATSADMKRKDKLKQRGSSESQVKQLMRGAKMGKSSNNLYMQFLYRCSTIAEELGFKHHVVAPFAPISYMCNTSNEKFTTWWYNRLEYSAGFMFQAKHFHGCSAAWPVTFTLWVSGGKTLTRSLKLDIREVIKVNKKEVITTTGVKTVRWVAKKDQLSTWLREPTKDKKRKRQILKIRKDPPQQVEAVPLSSGLSVGDNEVTQSDEALGCLANNRNIQVGDCCLLSSVYNHLPSRGIDVEAGESWRRAIVALAARSLPDQTWINHRDELQSPQQVEAVPLTSGLEVGDNEVTQSDEAVGSLANCCNNLHQVCCLLSSTFDHLKTPSIDVELGESWRRAIIALAARFLPNHTWLNHQDELQSPQQVEAVPLTSGLEVGDNEVTQSDEALGCLANGGNVIHQNCCLLSSTFANFKTPSYDLEAGDAWRRAIVALAARSLPVQTWVNDRDELQSPQQVEAVPLTSGLEVGTNEVTQSDEALAALAVNSNLPNDLTCLLASTFGQSKVTSVDLEAGESWRRAIVALAARSLPDQTWINHKDELHSPQQVEAVPLTSGLSVGENEVTLSDEALGCLANNGNTQVCDCYLLSSTQNHAGSPSIDLEVGEAWRRAVVALAARALPKHTWINHHDELHSPQQVEAVPLTSGLKVGDNEVTQSDEAVGCLANGGNTQVGDCCLLSSKYNPVGKSSVDLEADEAWRRAIVALAARSLPSQTWLNHHDELQSPSGSYEQWVDDCHVAALFFPKNNMTGMRGVKYNGKTWTLHNHSFWLTREEAVKFYTEARAWALVADARFNPTKLPNGDPYMSRLPLNLSVDALELLVDLTALWIDSIPYREDAAEDLHLTAWDAGVYQHKKLWATIPELEERWLALREKSRKLEDRLRDGIYKYKILVK